MSCFSRYRFVAPAEMAITEHEGNLRFNKLL